MTMMFTSARTSSIERYYGRRSFLDSLKPTTITTNIDESSFSQGISSWLSGLFSGDSNIGKESNSMNSLSLLKNFLLSTSSSGGSSSKINALFQVLSSIATDNTNQSSSSTNKLNSVLSFFQKYGLSSSSSSNLQLATKLMNLALGNGGFSSLSLSDMKSLVNLVSG
jgi:hypothetical protein